MLYFYFLTCGFVFNILCWVLLIIVPLLIVDWFDGLLGLFGYLLFTLFAWFCYCGCYANCCGFCCLFCYVPLFWCLCVVACCGY